MSYDKDLLIGKFNRWLNYLDKYSFPTWEQLPTIDLYMDQVITLITQYCGDLSSKDEDDSFITPNAINNYVRLKCMPAPVKKKYNRVHIAYLIMICMMRNTLSISEIKRVLPESLSEEEMQEVYTNFIRDFKSAMENFSKQILSVVSANAKDRENMTGFAHETIYAAVALSGMSKVIAKKMIDLEDKPFTEEAVSLDNVRKFG